MVMEEFVEPATKMNATKNCALEESKQASGWIPVLMAL